MRIVGNFFLSFCLLFCSCRTEKVGSLDYDGSRKELRKVVKTGKIVGTSTLYYPNGQKKIENYYSYFRSKNNHRYRPKLMSYWNSKGEQLVKNGIGYIPGKTDTLNYNGKITRYNMYGIEGHYKNGRRTGILVVGGISTTYKNGRKNGIETHYYYFGTDSVIKDQEWTFKKDKLILIKEYRGNKLYCIKNPDNKKLKYFYDNGNIKTKTKLNGKNSYTGKKKYYNENGKLDSIQIYKKHILVKTIKK